VRSRALAVGILIATVLGLAWTRLGPTPASAQATPDPGLQFYIAVDGVPNCDTKSGDATCTLAPGSTFVIDAYLEPLPSDIPSYDGFDIYLGYTGVTAQQDASTDAWPDCAIPAHLYDTGEVFFACIIGVPPAGPSTYTGLIGTNSFTCTQSGSIALVHGEGSTDLVEDLGKTHIESNPQEKLTINCVAGGVTPIPTTPHAGGSATSAPASTPLPPTAQAQATTTAKAKVTAAAKKTPTSTDGGNKDGGGGGGLSAGVIAIIVIAAVVVAGGAGFFGWRYLQSRRGAGGGT
jgi:hypothetical protein